MRTQTRNGDRLHGKGGRTNIHGPLTPLLPRPHDRPVQADRVRKSVGAERTFERDILQWDEVEPALQPVFAQVWAACTRGGHMGRTVTVNVKYADFQQVTRSRSGTKPVPTQVRLEQVSLDLLRPLFPPLLGVRLLGVTLSNLDAKPYGDATQLALSL